MDGSRFDAWTRRRFGLIAGGLATTLFGWTVPQVARAKKKKKHKKRSTCLPLGDVCNPSGNRICCQSLTCKPVPAFDNSNHCCQDVIGTPCAAPSDCCSGICLDHECQPTICKELGQLCFLG